MFEFLKNISDKNVCQSMGICSIDPTVSAIEELLLSEIREISFYVLKLKELGYANKEVLSNAIKGLSIIMINTSFDKEDFLGFLSGLCDDKRLIKSEYKKYCKANHLSCELIDFDYDACEGRSISAMTKIGEIKMQNKYRGITQDRQRMFELITLFAKSAAINLEQLKKFCTDTSEYDFEVLRFFNLTNSLSTRSEKLKRRILEFSKISFEIQEKTNDTIEKVLGKRQSAKVLLGTLKGKAILISGPDLNELKTLLDTIGERKINVYTNSTMFIAHTYPKFKEYKNLAGHIDTSDTQFDFANFPGAILITQNFVHKIDNLLRGTMYSNKVIAPNRVFKIKDNNYEPLIESAMKLDGFDKDENANYLEIKHSFDDIEQTLNSLKDQSVVIVVGENNTQDDIQDFNGKKIINLECPIESDLLLFTLKKCKELNIKTDLFFAQCSINAINTLMSTLYLNLEATYLVNCSSALINPHVMECLEKDFNVKILR